ncbi:2-oxo acid dehydrogenase subunit E2 [Actinokineospora xionganensis]|uniref:Dihydrolipoamide acetyltransferase component of pyruvate dehydrogenase complex n=1 Tax=Actinokineospora xionganensis TaxID=2684470 RepID=A0ABR7L018_9PSEU|nr:2-oxo acid dehydrogenase subunit E2 [Actinokineospora xionganensis]MBC6445868.1 2-oxo acid dehydrogenase subunit E2 [Actinokineospora xionganensis]
MAEFVMPSLGADMESGTVTEWLVKPGDLVRKGDVVAVVDTAKAAVEVECFQSGRVDRLLVPEGRSVPVGTPLAVITTDEAAAPTTPGRPDAPAPPDSAAAPVHTGDQAATTLEPPTRPATRPTTPIVRHLAKEAGLDLAALHGTGAGGAVTRHDIEQATPHPPRPAERPQTPPHPRGQQAPRVSPYARKLAADLGVDLAALHPGDGPVTAADIRAAAEQQPAQRQPAQRQPAQRRPVKARGVDNRTAIAALMSRANRDIPHYHLATTVDLDRALAWLREHNKALPVAERVLPAALLLKATALAAAAVPELNGHWVDGALQPSSTVDLGMAVAVRGGGLLVPVLPQADTLPLAEIMRGLREQATRARSGRPRASDLGQASITVTNLGDLGVEVVHGVIHPPQVALVGFGAVVERPWSVDGLLGVRPVVTVTLAADHRATDGAVGARFLHMIDNSLQTPEELL